MWQWLKTLFCGHPNPEFQRNIYGDEINLSGGNRSIWVCPNCGGTEYRPDPHYPSVPLAKSRGARR